MHRVFVGFRCNNRCVFCAQGDLRERGLPDLVEEDLSRVEPGATVAFVGGEPTLFDELPAWVARVRGLGAARVIVQTNGRRLAEPGLAAALAASGVDGLDVSLHGSTAEMHDFHTGVPGSFEETVAGLRLARSAIPRVCTTTVATRSNYRHLADVVRLTASLGVSGVHLRVAQRYGRVLSGGASLPPPPAMLAEVWSRAVATARELGVPCLAAGAGPVDPALAAWFAGLGVVDAGAAPPAP